MEQLIDYLKNLEINQRNIKNVFHKLSTDFRNLNVNFEDNKELAPIKDLMEDLDVLCGVLETDNRELNNIEKKQLTESIRECINFLEKKGRC